ncbi:hypothetical protein B0181_09440 [Moraxella caviae]|uniref:Copper chaperone CopZ n=1 Tax=Moraxella caviae TaxID=34060 RepID=A0A1S9ZWS2_9GAMM|nr:heavy metal-associated domain-containing protein [Moraxella caviae]OOR87849.1 hypothetical protein B0181_09440 [Moraxella caviae]STZ14884.1 Copper chaperone CopZ [Moraxella caviae]VEW11207.1 Copper chaperone CopZ [Moraxella caviae]VEW13692.1 Copper chaperone CopZ [Moraxella caviae]
MTMQTFNIDGMTCGGCAKSVQNAIMGVAGVQSVSVDFESGSAVVVADLSVQAAIREAIEDAGFDVE